LFSWGGKSGAILQIGEIKKSSSSSAIEAVYHQKKVKIEIPFTDEASIQNAIHCWCVLFILNKNIDAVANRFNSLYPIEMRLELKKGINHCTIINDIYSNDFYSLSIALDFLNQKKQHKKH
jgi:alanine racemase